MAADGAAARVVEIAVLEFELEANGGLFASEN